jgi:hypothetical protein
MDRLEEAAAAQANRASTWGMEYADTDDEHTELSTIEERRDKHQSS